jgi:hypothetical protein
MGVAVQAAVPDTNLDGTYIDLDQNKTLGHYSIKYSDETKEDVPYEYIALLINGSLIKNSNVVMENDRTLLPLRHVSEALGAEVGWNAETKKVSIKDGANTIELAIGDTVAKVNGKDVTLDVAPKIINDYTYVPVRFVGESLGCKVGWYGGKAYSYTQPFIEPEAHYFRSLPQVMLSRYPSDAKPLTEKEAIERAREVCIEEYEKGIDYYGNQFKYEPLYSETGEKYINDDSLDIQSSGLSPVDIIRTFITYLSIKSENDRFYSLNIGYELAIDKYTGEAYIFSDLANYSFRSYRFDDFDELWGYLNY